MITLCCLCVSCIIIIIMSLVLDLWAKSNTKYALDIFVKYRRSVVVAASSTTNVVASEKVNDINLELAAMVIIGITEDDLLPAMTERIHKIRLTSS